MIGKDFNFMEIFSEDNARTKANIMKMMRVLVKGTLALINTK